MERDSQVEKGSVLECWLWILIGCRGFGQFISPFKPVGLMCLLLSHESHVFRDICKPQFMVGGFDSFAFYIGGLLCYWLCLML